ncbi:hypothetical protein NQ317_010718 [Molorchus minor]|uniref:Uncharacterized protein n=1 Tax=Molorchus minor TaxID=1323400 RepID=A0ABQ9K5T6_9CUCU|nr:hypothetical protein NQ317_010718 [Molorchus minor]
MDRAELKGSPVWLMVVLGMSSDVDDDLHGLRGAECGHIGEGTRHIGCEKKDGQVNRSNRYMGNR